VARIVVIVDDSESVASSLALAFENIPGVQPVIAHSSAEALRLFGADDSNIAAIVTDFNLPVVDGFELIRRIRNLATYRNLPAIMITADEKAGKDGAAQSDGPNAIFPKPCSLKEVSRVLEELLA
jgi:two-component system, chemotaxis family, chemotaxis protein CheY